MCKIVMTKYKDIKWSCAEVRLNVSSLVLRPSETGQKDFLCKTNHLASNKALYQMTDERQTQ